MNRFKFRAYSPLEKRMIYGVVPIHDNTYAELEEVQGPDRGLYILSDGEVMQYTGLNDKNGVEIYQGDVLKWQNKIGEVVYEPDRAGYILDWHTEGIYDYEELDCDFVFESKILGNIYENPESLNN